jgi:hypothetical protein
MICQSFKSGGVVVALLRSRYRTQISSSKLWVGYMGITLSRHAEQSPGAEVNFLRLRFAMLGSKGPCDPAEFLLAPESSGLAYWG